MLIPLSQGLLAAGSVGGASAAASIATTTAGVLLKTSPYGLAFSAVLAAASAMLPMFIDTPDPQQDVSSFIQPQKR